MGFHPMPRMRIASDCPEFGVYTFCTFYTAKNFICGSVTRHTRHP